MKYMLSVIDDMTIRSESELKTGTATTDEMAAIDAFNDRLVADGHWVFAAWIAERSHSDRQPR